MLKSVFVNQQKKLKIYTGIQYYPFQLYSPFINSSLQTEIKLSSGLFNRLNIFMSLQNNLLNKLDCHAFIDFIKFSNHNVLNYPNTFSREILRNHYCINRDDYQEESVVAIYKEKNGLYYNIHSSLYLGNNLYLSKFGFLDIGISTREMLIDTYKDEINGMDGMDEIENY